MNCDEAVASVAELGLRVSITLDAANVTTLERGARWNATRAEMVTDFINAIFEHAERIEIQKVRLVV